MMTDYKPCGRKTSYGSKCPDEVVGRIGKPIKDESDPSIYVCYFHALEAHDQLFAVDWFIKTPDHIAPLDTLIDEKHLRVTGSTDLRVDRFGRWLPGKSPDEQRAQMPEDQPTDSVQDSMTVPHL
jgi:hypothetical protein